MPIGATWSRSADFAGVIWTPEVRTFYIREMADASAAVRTSFDAVREVSFIAESGYWGRNSARLGGGLNAQIMSRLNFRIEYDYEVYAHTTISELSAALSVKW
jgi:outer membrane autotransporter protein